MTIALCGGGTGGHITPLLAVASELKKRPEVKKIVYIGEKRGKFTHIAQDSGLFDEIHLISAGKFRRYHGQSLKARILDFETNLLNIRDLFRFIQGTFESYILLKKIKPSSLMLKGGFVCVPIAFAANLRKIPYITHDSDALPGLANRIASKWAKHITTALPAEYYPYDQSKVKVVGVPTGFKNHTISEIAKIKSEFGLDLAKQVLLITGGSSGARRLNSEVLEVLPQLLNELPDLFVLHQLGAGNQDQIETIKALHSIKSRVKFFDYTDKLSEMSACADLIVTRAGATAMASHGLQSKACIVVPHPNLAGGHQLHNAKVYKEADAAVVLQEKDLQKHPKLLLNTILELLKKSERRQTLGNNLHGLNPKTDASKLLADLICKIG